MGEVNPNLEECLCESHNCKLRYTTHRSPNTGLLGESLQWVPNSNLPSREPTNPKDGDVAVASWKKALEEIVRKRWPLLPSAQIEMAMSTKVQ